MHPLTQLKPLSDIFCVETPLLSLHHKIKDGILTYKYNGKIIKEEFPFANWKLLGVVTGSEVGFDAANIVEPFIDPIEFNKGTEKEFKAYKAYDGEKLFYKDSNDSLRSLLSANGVYFENPDPRPNVEDDKFDHADWEEWFDSEIEYWNKINDKLIKGKLVVLKLLK